MKRILMNGLAGLLPVVVVCAQVTPAADSDEILRLEQRWNEAHLRSDVKALENLWADDITIIVPGMRPLNKTDVVKMWRSMPVRFSRYESTADTIRVFDETAVVSGSLTRTRDFGGRIAEEHWHFTKVYRHTEGRWTVIVFHASDAPR